MNWRRTGTCLLIAAACAGLLGVVAKGAARTAVPAHSPSTLPVVAGGGDEGSSAPTLAPGLFLIAEPSLRDPNFQETVVLLVQYGEGGALGLVVNSPTDVDLAHAFPELAAEPEAGDGWVFYGGPVQRGHLSLLLLTEDEHRDTAEVVSGLRVGHSARLLAEVTGSRRAPRFRVYSGYTGWSAGQLEREVALGSWVLRGALAEEVFYEEPKALWRWLLRAGPTQMAALPLSVRIAALSREHGRMGS